jgi:hypothetical protein
MPAGERKQLRNKRVQPWSVLGQQHRTTLEQVDLRNEAGLLVAVGLGFTAGRMEVRIQNAKDDPTFLMAAVHPVATYTLYNIDRVKLEHLLHTFFSEVRLNLEITDRFGKKIKPREWFLLPPEVIAEAVSRLKDGSIVNFQYDAGRAAIIPLDSQCPKC